MDKPASEAPIAPAPAPAEPTTEPADEAGFGDFGGNEMPAEEPMDDMSAEAPSNDMPDFEKEPFDAGVDANEESDPKKFIEQLSGKLGQSLRQYTKDQGQPDFELEKFAINSVISASHTAEMDEEDRNDIIKKIEKSGEDETQDFGDDNQAGADAGDDSFGGPDNGAGASDEFDFSSGDAPVQEGKFMLDKAKKLSIFAPEGSEEAKFKHINEDEFIKNIAHINDIVTIKKSKEIYNLLSNMFPNAKEVIDYHFKDELGQPFAEWRRLIYEIDNYVLTGPKMVNPDLIELDDETITDRQAKYNQYIKDKEAGKPAQYFRGNDTDPRSIDFSKLPPITLIAVGGKYELVDGAHRIFLAKQANKPLKAYIWVKQKNTHPNVAKIKSLFNQTNTNLEEKWSEDYKKSIDCKNPKGFSQKAHCDARKKRQRGEETKSKSVSEDTGKSAKKQFKNDLQDDPDYLKYKDNDNEFGVPNVTTSDPFIKKDKYSRVGKEDLDELTVYEAKKTDFSKEKSQGLHGWFSRKGGEGSSGWVDCNTCRKDPKTGRKKCKPCGRQDGEKRKYPACRPTPSACGTRGKGKKWGKKSTSEGLNISENFSIFNKNYLKMRLQETFNHEEPLVLPAEPKTKPKESPMIQPSRRNKPFLPERETQPDPKAEN